MNIEVGEYIRDKNGFIIKVNEIQEYKEDDDIWYEQEMLKGTWRSMVLKHSKNIIDLIEEGDYVNGYEVMNIYKPRDIWEPIEIEIDSKCTRCFLASEIKTIVTKEQFKGMEYRINE